MYRIQLRLALVLASAFAAGCTPDSPAGPLVVTVDDAPLVNPPLLTQADLAQRDSVELKGEEPVEGPAAASFDEDSLNRPIEQIFNARSTGDFQAGFAGVYGTHEYIGNVGRITTTANVSYNQAHLGSMVGTKQQYTPFLGDFGRTKRIDVFPKIYTDKTCGLVVEGSSQHHASWQFYQATSVQNWGVVQEFTQAKPYAQGACSGQTGGFQTENTQPGGIVCTYWITYDLDTGEIVDAQLLFCSSTGGDVI